VDQLHGEGFTGVDCGDVAAYPTRVGTRLVCRVTDRGRQRYLVATVTDRHGTVGITDY
jgi:hypothetical protein